VGVYLLQDVPPRDRCVTYDGKYLLHLQQDDDGTVGVHHLVLWESKDKSTQTSADALVDAFMQEDCETRALGVMRSLTVPVNERLVDVWSRSSAGTLAASPEAVRCSRVVVNLPLES